VNPVTPRSSEASGRCTASRDAARRRAAATPHSYYDIAENDVAGDGSGLPDECPHCHEPLDESRRINPGVARCSHECCNRLVYAGMQYV
jgi:hypothetical protein